MPSRLRRPSPALVISVLALVVALAGTATAAHLINGRTIRKGSIPGDRIKRNDLTGKRIRENALGKVPRARRADLAFSSLSTQGWVPQELFRRQAKGTALTKILDAGPVSIYLGCSSSGSITLRAVPIAPGVRAQVAVISSNNKIQGGLAPVLNPGGNADLDQGLSNGQATATFIGASNAITSATYTFGSGSNGCLVAGELSSHG